MQWGQRLRDSLATIRSHPVRRLTLSTGAYIFVAGTVLIIRPELFSLVAPGLTDASTGMAALSQFGVSLFWLRIGGVLCQLFGIYYAADSLFSGGFVMGTIIGRVYLFLAFMYLYISSPDAPVIIPVFAALNLASAVLTMRGVKILARVASEVQSLSAPQPISKPEEAVEVVGEAEQHEQTGSSDMELQHFSPARLLTTLDAETTINSVEFDCSGTNLLLALSDHRVLLIRAATGEVVREIRERGCEVLSATFCDDGRICLSCVDRESRAAMAMMYGAHDAALLRRVRLPQDEAISVEICPDGEMAIVKRHVEGGSMALELRHLSSDKGQIQRAWTRNLGDGLAGVIATRVRWSKDRSQFAVGVGSTDRSAAVVVCQTSDGKPVAELKTGAIPVVVDVDSEHGRALAGCLDKRIRVYNTKSASEVYCLDATRISGFNVSAKFSSDGAVVAVPVGRALRLFPVPEKARGGSKASAVGTGDQQPVDLSMPLTSKSALKKVDFSSDGSIVASTAREVFLWQWSDSP